MKPYSPALEGSGFIGAALRDRGHTLLNHVERQVIALPKLKGDNGKLESISAGGFLPLFFPPVSSSQFYLQHDP